MVAMNGDICRYRRHIFALTGTTRACSELGNGGRTDRLTAARQGGGSSSVRGRHGPPCRPVEGQLEPMTAAAAAPDDGALPAGQHLDELLAEAGAVEAVEVEVDGVVGVEEEERDGLERHQDVGDGRVDLADGEDEADGGERRREDEPRERHDQQHRRHLHARPHNISL